MFSKALYKQSWKANWIQWLAVTLVSSFVLVIIMMMSGGDGIGSLTSSFKETFAKQALQSQFENTAINYHYVSNESLETFDQAFLDQYLVEIQSNPYQAPTEENIMNAYQYAISHFQEEADRQIKGMDETYTEETAAYQELLGAAMFTFNPSGVMNDLYEQYEVGSTPLDYDIMTIILSVDSSEMMAIWATGELPENYGDVITSLERIAYRTNRARASSSIFMAGNMSSPEAKEAILETLAENNITKKTYDSFGFDYLGLKTIGSNAIVTFQARLDFEISKLNSDDYPTIDAYFAAVKAIKEELQASITESLLTKLPAALSESMVGMQEYDVYIMTVGNMYFKIVGLLISVVFVIVVGVNLIAGQVDSGSMAYILSTGTTRNSVTITQMIFFVSSTLFLYLTTSIVSVVCFFIAPPASTSVTLGTLLLFNLGAFLVTMALGGIIYLASCIFNRSKRAMAIGGGFAVLTLVATILGLFASETTPTMMRMSALDPFNYVSLVSLYDISAIVDGNFAFIWKFAILGIVAVICFALGIVVFKKKDLPL